MLSSTLHPTDFCLLFHGTRETRPHTESVSVYEGWIQQADEVADRSVPEQQPANPHHETRAEVVLRKVNHALESQLFTVPVLVVVLEHFEGEASHD
jgi:hypothetical protein